MSIFARLQNEWEFWQQEFILCYQRLFSLILLPGIHGGRVEGFPRVDALICIYSRELPTGQDVSRCCLLPSPSIVVPLS